MSDENAIPAPESLWTESQVAAYLNTSIWCLRNARTRGRGTAAGLPYIKLGDGPRGVVRYDPAAVRAFAAARSTVAAAA